MTNADQAEALIVTVHSCATTGTEILSTEFVTCYLAAKTALEHDSVHQELNKVPTGTQGSLRRKWREYNMLGFRSPMRGLPVSSTYAPSAIPYLFLLIQIRLVSIHRQDIRILTTYFSKEYYQSFKVDQPPSGSLRVRIESFRLPDYEEAEIAHILQKLTKE
jgi:hypothetical protein